MTLFAPDNLCRLRASFAPSSTPLALGVADVARTHFGLARPDVSASSDLNGLTECFLVEDDVTRRRLFVKTSRHAGAPARFRREAECSIRLCDAGAPVPRALLPVVEWEERSVLAFPYIEGAHFSGEGAQLERAAAAFGALTTVATDVLGNVDAPGAPPLARLLDELVALYGRARSDARTAPICAAYAADVARAIDRVSRRVDELVAPTAWTHVDYHPLNLLFRGDELAAVLDFEDLLRFPVAIASGFAAYKLIRRAAVTANGHVDASLASTWARATRQEIDLPLLALGSRARALMLLHLILEHALDQGDDRFVYDLPKHASSFAEMDRVFDQENG